jgi:hypothetical protein
MPFLRTSMLSRSANQIVEPIKSHQAYPLTAFTGGSYAPQPAWAAATFLSPFPRPEASNPFPLSINACDLEFACPGKLRHKQPLSHALQHKKRAFARSVSLTQINYVTAVAGLLWRWPAQAFPPLPPLCEAKGLEPTPPARAS